MISMALIRHRPGRGLSRTEEFLDRLFPEFFPIRWMTRELQPDVDWIPAADLVDKKDHFLLSAELPGVKKEDTHIPVEGSTLKVTGEMKREKEEEEENYYCCERSYGSFGRVFRLPAEVDEENVDARLKDGLLEVKLPKKEHKKREKNKIELK